MDKDVSNKCRLDKWLWAARFYKTRSLAADAIDSGKVRVDGERAKPAKEVKLSMRVSLRQQIDTLEVTVMALSNVRRGAPEAALLYQETDASITARDANQLARQATIGLRERGAGRPTKRQMREIKQFTGMNKYRGE